MAVRGAEGGAGVRGNGSASENKDDAGGLFRAWLEGIIQDFRNGTHSGDPKAANAAAREGAQNGKGRQVERVGQNNQHQQPTLNATESSALAALSSLGGANGSGDASTQASPVASTSGGGGGGGGGSGQPLLSVSELIRTA